VAVGISDAPALRLVLLGDVLLEPVALDPPHSAPTNLDRRQRAGVQQRSA
jgi:hypothetical protein